MQVRDIWWVYVGIALAIFLMMTSRNPNDYRGMEHGSARWADKYDERMFTDKTGIPCGDNFYVTVENPEHKFYSSHNLNEIVIGGLLGQIRQESYTVTVQRYSVRTATMCVC